jgi:hypothetical protein
MFMCMIFFYGIDQKVQFVMTPFSLHLTSMMQLGMRSNNPLHRGNLCWAPPCLSLALGWLMAHSSRSTNLGTMLHTKLGSMSTRRSTQWTTLYVVHPQSLFIYLTLYIQTGLKTQVACLKTHKRQSKKYKFQHVVQSPRMTWKPSTAEGTFFDNFGAFSWAGWWGSRPIWPPIDFWAWLGHGMAQIYPNQSKEANHTVWSWGIDCVFLRLKSHRTTAHYLFKTIKREIATEITTNVK